MLKQERKSVEGCVKMAWDCLLAQLLLWAALPLTSVPSCKMEVTALASQGHQDYSRNPVIGWAGDDIIEKGFTH